MNKMRFKTLSFVLVGVIFLVGFSGSACFADLSDTYGNPVHGEAVDSVYWDNYSASSSLPKLEADGGGLVGMDGWNSDGTTLAWVIEFNSTTQLYSYTYYFTVPSKSPSHIIVEVSPEFQSGDFTDYSALGGEPAELRSDSTDPTTWGPSSANPYMPGNIPGIKFDSQNEGSSDQVTFTSNRIPVWGNFYSADGFDQTTQLYAAAWNTGFDPTISVDTYDFGIYVPRPDTVVPVPGAVLLGLLGLSVAGIKLRKYA